MVDRVSVPAQEGLTNSPADNMNPGTEAGKPKWLPDKFATPEDMAKSYAELERQYTQLRQGKLPVEEPKPQPKQEELPPQPQQTVEDVKSLLPGFTDEQITEFSNQAFEHGTLTDEQYKALADKGFSKEIVDQYIQGQLALVEGQRNALINAGGGEERVQEMFTWAAQSLDKQQIEWYNTKFDAGGPDALMAMENLAAKYAASGQAKPTGTAVTGANAPGFNTDTFTSVAQVQEAMSDPRYKTDPAFRKAVAEKLGRSNVL